MAVKIVRGPSFNAVECMIVESVSGDMLIYLSESDVTSRGARALADVLDRYIECQGGFRHGENLPVDAD